MINISELSLNFSGEPLFKDVNLKFTAGQLLRRHRRERRRQVHLPAASSRGDLEPSTGHAYPTRRGDCACRVLQARITLRSTTTPCWTPCIGGNKRLLRHHAARRTRSTPRRPFTEEDGNTRRRAGGRVRRAGRLGRRDRTQPSCSRVWVWTRTRFCTPKMKIPLADVTRRSRFCSLSALFGNPDILLHGRADQPPGRSGGIAGWRTSSRSTSRARSSLYRMTVTSSTMYAPTSWISTTARSSCMSATTSSGTSPLSSFSA